MSSGETAAAAAAAGNGAASQAPPAAPLSEETKAQVQQVLTSDVRRPGSLTVYFGMLTSPPQIGITVMLNRLKQSIASAKVRNSPTGPPSSQTSR